MTEHPHGNNSVSNIEEKNSIFQFYFEISTKLKINYYIASVYTCINSTSKQHKTQLTTFYFLEVFLDHGYHKCMLL